MGRAYVIPLVAAGNRGKTRTLNILATLFIQKYGHLESSEYLIERLDDNMLSEIDDNQYAFRIQSSMQKAIVIITTKGDDGDQINEAKRFVDRFWTEKSKEDLFWFLACRTSRSSWNRVEGFDEKLSDGDKRYWMYKGNLWTSDKGCFKDELQRLQSEWNRQDAIRLMEVFNSIVRSEGQK